MAEKFFLMSFFKIHPSLFWMFPKIGLQTEVGCFNHYLRIQNLSSFLDHNTGEVGLQNLKFQKKASNGQIICIQ